MVTVVSVEAVDPEAVLLLQRVPAATSGANSGSKIPKATRILKTVSLSIPSKK